jgi:hypothetical protein
MSGLAAQWRTGAGPFPPTSTIDDIGLRKPTAEHAAADPQPAVVIESSVMPAARRAASLRFCGSIV